MSKMGKTMIAACSVAIGSIYATGYINTLSDAQAVQVTPAHQKKTTDQTDNQTIVNDSWGEDVAYSNKKQSSASAESSAPKTKYKDGTYSGQGSNRIGTVYVSVTIKNDRIDTVEITEADTHYSQSYIEDLPAQVVQRQSSDVDVVSGATLSTEDFQNAVDDALQQAMNA
ncbi:FMN-binding protein [Priestia megaterium]|uniref:FMN-binding protein n=1 Tax=Priestia megaterium TaxID=1404 RepID=UPI002FE10764